MKNQSEWCMNFTDDEITKYLTANITNEECNFFTEQVDEQTDDMVSSLEYSGYNNGDFFLNFYGFQTSLFVGDKEIMFIDDNLKNNYTASDTYKNIVYEGALNNLSHEEILLLLSKFISIFYSSKIIKVTEETLICADSSYPRFSYIVTINTQDTTSFPKQIANIRFVTDSE